MTGKVTDEMLMAFVDGETDEATAAMIGRTMAADPALAARADRFRASRALMRDAFGDARREPVPQRLVEAALADGADAKVVAFPRLKALRFALPLAASLAVAFGVGFYFAGQSGTGPADPFGREAIAGALSVTPAGESRMLALAGDEARLQTLATYRVEGGLCRSFDLVGGGTALSGVGCDTGAGWGVDLIVARAPGDLYAPASGAALHGIDAYLDALEASAPLTAEEEADL